MKKYIVLIKNGAQNLLAYRVNFFAWYITEGISVLVMAYIFISIYKEGGKVADYSLRSLVAYFIMTRIINMIFAGDDVSANIASDINQGRMNNYILKPLNYNLTKYFTFFGDNLMALAMSLPILFSIIYFFRDLFLLNFQNILFFSGSLFISSLIFYSFYYIIGLMSFFMGNVSGLSFMSWLFILLFSGRLMPIETLPHWIESTARFLPFKYTVSEPLNILYGKLSAMQAFESILIGLFWFILMALVGKVIYHKGLKKYESFGG